MAAPSPAHQRRRRATMDEDGSIFAPTWRRVLLALTLLGLLAGVLAARLDGAGRRASIAALVAAGLGLALLASSRGMPHVEHAMGGSGYDVPLRRRVHLLHVLVTLLHNLGIMVVVFAAMVRFGIVPVDFNAAVVQAFPLAIATYLAFLSLAAKWRIDDAGGVRQTWYTRTHGLFLAALGIGVLAGSILLLLTDGRLQVAGHEILVDQDVEVLALVAMLGVGTQMFLAADLPTIFDLGSRFLRLMGSAEDRRKSVAGTPPIVYAGLLALTGAGVVGYVLYRFDVVSLLGDFQDARVGLIVLVFPLFMVLFFGISAGQIVRESRRGLYKRKIPTNVRSALAVYITSSVLGLVSSVLMVMSLTGNLDHLGPIQGGHNLSKDLIATTVLVIAGPIGVHKHRQNRRVDAIEARLPDFLNDLAETRRAGLTLTAALQSAALSDYGPLSKEVRKMADQVGWGVPFTEALAQFATRVPTSLVRRSTYLIIESSRTGGSVSEILKAAAKDAYEIKGLEAERRTSMMTYMIVIYVVFFVFMAVIAVLDRQFIPQVLAANKAVNAAGSTAQAGSFGGGSGIDEGTLRFSYYLAGIVQAIGNGIVGGVLSEGRVMAGLRHVAIMTACSWVLFRLVLG